MPARAGSPISVRIPQGLSSPVSGSCGRARNSRQSRTPHPPHRIARPGQPACCIPPSTASGRPWPPQGTQPQLSGVRRCQRSADIDSTGSVALRSPVTWHWRHSAYSRSLLFGAEGKRVSLINPPACIGECPPPLLLVRIPHVPQPSPATVRECPYPKCNTVKGCIPFVRSYRRYEADCGLVPSGLRAAPRTQPARVQCMSPHSKEVRRWRVTFPRPGAGAAHVSPAIASRWLAAVTTSGFVILRARPGRCCMSPALPGVSSSVMWPARSPWHPGKRQGPG
jgi:hypothetical protein